MQNVKPFLNVPRGLVCNGRHQGVRILEVVVKRGAAYTCPFANRHYRNTRNSSIAKLSSCGF